MKPSGKISKHAFTLVELLAVIAIIGILAAITMGIYGSVKRKGVESRLKAELAAIELALENYKAKNNQYPYSESWGDYMYPPKNWTSVVTTAPLGNQLYRDLVTKPMGEEPPKKPYLPDVKESQYELDAGGQPLDYLLTNVTDVRSDSPAKWYYNSNDPRYNKNSYDLWVEYGDLGKDINNPSDDTVKIISNWNK